MATRRSTGVDTQRLPFRCRDVRLVRPRVRRHGPILDHGAGRRPHVGRHQPRGAPERSGTRLGEQRDRRPSTRGWHTHFHVHPREAEVGVERPHPDRHGCVGRYDHDGLGRLLDRDLGREIGKHLDAMLEGLRDRVGSRGTRHPGHEHESIRLPPGPLALGVEPQSERAGRTGRVLAADGEFDVVRAVAVEVDPGGIERPVALGDDRHLRALHRAQIALPFNRVGGASRVGGILVPHLPHEQRGRVHDRHAQPLGAGVTGCDHELDRLVDAAVVIRQRRDIPIDPFGITPAGGHRRGPATVVVPNPEHAERGPLVSAQPADRRRDDDLPAPHHGRHVLDDGERTGRMIRLGGRFPGASPSKARRLDRDAGGGRDACPWRDEPGGRGEDALRREERVDAGENDERGEPQREPQR